MTEPMPPIVQVFILAGAAIMVAGLAMLALKFINWREHMSSRGVRSVTLEPSYDRRFSYEFEPEPEPSNLDEPALERRTNERTGAFVLNPEECAAIARMIDHKTTAEKPTKASTIWAGFGVKKGESARYKRASLIYDELFVLKVETTPIAQRPTDAQFASDVRR